MMYVSQVWTQPLVAGSLSPSVPAYLVTPPFIPLTFSLIPAAFSTRQGWVEENGRAGDDEDNKSKMWSVARRWLSERESCWCLQ